MRLTYRDSTVPHTNEKGELWEAYSDYPYNEVINKLAAYEDAEERGRLVVFPLGIGDTFYSIERFCDGSTGECDSFVPCDRCPDYEPEIIERKIRTITQAAHVMEDMNKTVFLTSEEAEAALKGETT